MKRFPVKYRPDALEDIEAVFLYVLEASQNFTTASNFTDRIFKRCESIGDIPQGGVARPDLGGGIRIVPFEKTAVILYRLNGDVVEIVNVFYGGRDYEAILGNKR